MEPISSFDDVCKYVGELYLRHQHSIHQITQTANDKISVLEAQVSQLNREKEALAQIIHQGQINGTVS